MLLFNNCHNRPHEQLYGTGAFFDLDQLGTQGQQARNLAPGEECVVASAAKDGLVFDRWKLSRVAIMPSREGNDVRVFFGERLRSTQMTREDARRSALYGAYFDSRGHLHQTSVVRNNRL